MKITILPLLFCLTVSAADIKISELPIITSPSTNTFIPVSDMDAAPKSRKYLLTNLVTQTQLATFSPLNQSALNLSGTAIDLSLTNRVFSKTLGADTTFTFSNLSDGYWWNVILTNGASWTVTWPTVTWLGGSAPVMDTGAGVVNVFSFTRQAGVTFGDVAQKASTTLNSISALANGTGALTNNGSGTFGYYDYSAILAPKADPTFTGTATIPTASVATQTLGTGTVTNNIGAKITVGDTTFVDLSKASQTNDASGGTITLAHATNGIANVHLNHVRWVFASADTTLTLGTGAALWRTNVYSAVPPKFTNGTITKIVLESWHETDTSAKQTNCFVSFEYFK